MMLTTHQMILATIFTCSSCFYFLISFIELLCKPSDALDSTLASRREARNFFSATCKSVLAKACNVYSLYGLKSKKILEIMTQLGLIMMITYVCDRTDVFNESRKRYNRDLFLFLMISLTCVAFGSTLERKSGQPSFLCREQSNEWKGWMQVIFILYHYFKAVELYNAVRVFVACYIWMTGYGNFMYYYTTNDFSLARFIQMLWRINFLACMMCMLLQNSYMVYYICPLHTFFTIMVYACLKIGHDKLNHHAHWILIKFSIAGVIMYAMSYRSVFNLIWSPLTSLVGYSDPRRPNPDVLHEWYFRVNLDRYVWIHGMIVAFLHIKVTHFFSTLNKAEYWKLLSIKIFLFLSCCVAGYWWFEHIYKLPKPKYNKVHPYTSWIPITIWIIVRNLTESLQLHFLHLFSWIGCITLETYVCQYHVWMKTSVPDGQPRTVISIFPSYPLVNFAVVTSGFFFLSHRLFLITNELKAAIVNARTKDLQILLLCGLCMYVGLLSISQNRLE